MPSVDVWAFPNWTSHGCRRSGASDPAPSTPASLFSPSASQTCRCLRALVKILSVTVCILPTLNFPICHRSAVSGAGAFCSASGSLQSISLSDVPLFESIGADAFSGCLHLSSMDFSGLSSLCSIGDGAFRLCNSLQSISLANLPLLESIGDEAFCGCGHLSIVDFSGLSSLRSIGEAAFQMCESLQSISLANLPLLESIGNNAFSGCAHLSNADLSGLSSLRSIGGWRVRNVRVSSFHQPHKPA